MSEVKKDEGKWAPWWIYAILIAGSNMIKQALVPDEIPAWANGAITVVLIGGLFLGITAVYRTMHSAKQRS